MQTSLKADLLYLSPKEYVAAVSHVEPESQGKVGRVNLPDYSAFDE